MKDLVAATAMRPSENYFRNNPAFESIMQAAGTGTHYRTGVAFSSIFLFFTSCTNSFAGLKAGI